MTKRNILEVSQNLGNDFDLPYYIYSKVKTSTNEKVISPRGDTIIDKNDSVVLLSTYEVIKQVEKLFSVRVDFF